MHCLSLPRNPLLLALACAAALWWLGFLTVAVQTEAASDTPAATPAAEKVVEIRYLKYDPDPVEIMAGETVTWVNRDALPHTVTATTGNLPKSETLGLGDHYTQTFSEPGTYDYICLYHAQMHGTLIVRPE